MDINRIIKLVQKIPPDKLHDEKAVKKVLMEAGKEAGKPFSDKELDQLAKQFTKIISSGSGLGLIGSLLQKGFSKKVIQDIQKKMNE